LNVAFAGTGEFGIPSLRCLTEADLAPVLVISQPDRRKGRKGAPTPPPLAAAAFDLGLPVFQPERLNQEGARARLSETGADVLVVVAYGQLLRRKVLDLPRLGCVNVHGSLLPRHRGASPIQAAILAGDSVTGVTVMQMDEGLDSGPVLLQLETEIDSSETGGALHDRLAEMGGPLLVRALRGLQSGDLSPDPQDHGASTACGMIEKRDGLLDWGLSAEDLQRRVRAYDPWPGAHTMAKIRERDVRFGIFQVTAETGSGGEPGAILDASADGLVIATGQGALRVQSIQPAGKRRMDAGAFLRGYPLRAGDRFAMPTDPAS